MIYNWLRTSSSLHQFRNPAQPLNSAYVVHARPFLDDHSMTLIVRHAPENNFGTFVGDSYWIQHYKVDISSKVTHPPKVSYIANKTNGHTVWYELAACKYLFMFKVCSDSKELKLIFAITVGDQNISHTNWAFQRVIRWCVSWGLMRDSWQFFEPNHLKSFFCNKFSLSDMFLQ